MAVSPQEVYTLTTEEQALICSMEEWVDDGLRHQAKWEQFPIVLSVPDQCTPRLLRELIRRYTEVGWEVKHRAAESQRDEDSLSFRPKEPIG